MEKSNFIPSIEKPLSLIKVDSATIASESHGDRNEDSILIDKKNNFFAVFDGAGGHKDGDKASQMAKECVSYGMDKMPKGLSLEETQDYITDLLAETNKQIGNAARNNKTDMITTAVVAAVVDKKAIIASVGDSRAYLFSESGLEKITIDDDMARYKNKHDTKKIKEIQKKLANVTNLNALTKEDREYFDKRNVITAALGDQGFHVQTYIVDLKPGNRILLCSDGLTDNLTENQIETLLSDKRKSADHLVDEAYKTSKDIFNVRQKKDDISAIVVEIPSKEISGESYIKPGDRVNVIRSSGELNSRYKVAFINDNNVATVTMWLNENDTSVKHIPVAELEKINSVPKTIDEAKNIPDLYRYLKSIGTIDGSKKTYTSEELIKIIDGVENKEFVPELITNTGGLRNKVKELLEI